MMLKHWYHFDNDNKFNVSQKTEWNKQTRKAKAHSTLPNFSHSTGSISMTGAGDQAADEWACDCEAASGNQQKRQGTAWH